MSGLVTRYQIRTRKGELVAIHARLDTPAGKRFWWEGVDGTPGLPVGVGASDLPLFGSELAPFIPMNEYLVVTEGERDAMALRAGGVQALATVTGATSCHTSHALFGLARFDKFLLWPDNDDVGLAHMLTLARNMYAAKCAREVRIIGLDSPETSKPGTPVECFAKEATAAAKALLSPGDEITLQPDPTQDQRDRFGRLLAHVLLPDGSLFAAHMIAGGWAVHYIYDGIPSIYADELAAAEAQAREAGVGLWSDETCAGDEHAPSAQP